MVIFEGKQLNPKGEVPDTLYGMSEKEWTGMELFHYWMINQFVPLHVLCCYFLTDTPLIMSQTQFVLLKTKELYFDSFHIPHVSQPLDVSFFHPLKAYWSDACHKYIPGHVVTKY